jgi:inhibitor of KinA
VRIAPFGERAILVTFTESLDPEANERCRALADAWEARGLGPAVPAYASALLHYDPLAHPRRDAVRLARTLAARRRAHAAPGRLVEIPVRYDGPDLAEVARLSRIPGEELVVLHSDREYRAYFLGFLPGFAYLGELDPRIVAPRLAEPRTRVPPGAVAVAGRQTGIYPFASPGGWRLIGTTDVVLFDPGRDPTSLIQTGDRVRFVAR